MDKQLLAVQSLEPSIRIIASIQPISKRICLLLAVLSFQGESTEEILQVLVADEDWTHNLRAVVSLLSCLHFCIVFDSVKVILGVVRET